MDASNVGFLDDISLMPINTPVKTSTVVKEKWNEEAFFKRQGHAEASESFGFPHRESPISARTDPEHIPEEFKQKLRFPLQDNSFTSDGTSSSLGILQVENFDLSDSSFNEPIKFSKKQKFKKKLVRTSNVCHEDNGHEFKNKELEEKSLRESSEAIPSNLDGGNSDDTENDNDSNSSDIEYDGTNIPELNMDCDILSLMNSARASRNNTLNNANKPEPDNTRTVSGESNLPDITFSSSQVTRDMIFKSDSTSRESSVNVRNSIFENFEPSFDSFYKQLISEKDLVEKNKDEKIPQKIRVCPFLNVSSFEVDPILGKQSQSSIYSDIENTRCNQNLSVDFCPEQISARSSSFKSSRQFESSSSSAEKSDFKITEDFSQTYSLDHSKQSLPKEDLENEVLNGSRFRVSGSKVEFQTDGYGETTEDIDSGFSPKSVNSDAFKKNDSKNMDEFGDLAFQSDLQHKHLSGFVPDGENWCSRLGISESEFFSSDAAKEILRKDKEVFEKEQMFESFNNSNKVSSVSNWSLTNEHEVVIPWLSGLNPDQKINSSRQISVGTFISSRSENVGTLSDDTERERPYFGKVVITPPKIDASCYEDPFVERPSIDTDNTMKKLRISALSEFLDEISTTDPVNFASKLVEKCNPTVQKESKKLFSGHDMLNEKTLFKHNTKLHKNTSVLSDIEESEKTLIRSASSNNVSEQTDEHEECKSTTSEPAQSMDNFLNSSLGSSSIKTVKSDTCSNCCHPSTQHNIPQFSRPTSSCSSTCNTPLPLDTAVSLQYGSMKYLNSCTGANRNCFHSLNVLQAGNSGFPCPHVCTHHALQPNSYQSVIQNTVAGPVLLSGPIASDLGIQVPSELCYPEKIALGDSQEMNLTIQNSLNVGCFYKISYVSAYLNDSPLPFEMSGLSYNKTVPSSAGNNTDIKLVLAPKYEGKIEVNLQIDAFFNSMGQTLNAPPISTAKTKIQYDVLRPSITMRSKEKDTLNIGSVVAGSTFVEYITVTNNCEVSVPLRISLSNDSLENQIYFGLKEMDRQKHPMSGGLRFLSPKVLLYRIPASKNKSLPSSLDIPIVFESINGRVDSTITAAIETPSLSEVLAFIKVTATGGNAKLVLKDPNQNPLILKAFKGATCNHSVTVINVGSLPVVYDIHIDGDNDVLSVSPSSLNLQPNQSATISVTFTPSTYLNVKGNLLAAAEPHGQVFCVTEIIGHVKANSVKSHHSIPQSRSSMPTRDSTDFVCGSSSLIECNRKYLAWGGVDIGKSCGMKTCTIRNPSQDAVKVKLFIKTKSQEFLLIDDTGENTTFYELTLKAREEKLVSVTFIPKSVVLYSGLLCIKPVSENDHRVFSIPLSGYGGTSNLKVLGLPDGEGTGYCLDVDVSHETDVNKNIVFHNVGCRPAFVKLLITYDGFVQNLVEKQTVIHPSEFILLENEKKSVLVSISCMNKNLISNNEVILILYGDEIMRQRLRRKLKSSSSKNQNPAYNINFNVPYDGEDKVLYDPSYKSSPKDESLFYSQLRKMMIHILFNGQNSSFSRMSFAALSGIQESFSNLTLNSTMSSRRLTTEGHSPPVKESVFNMSRLSLPAPFHDDSSSRPVTRDSAVSLIADYLNDMKLDSWTVAPEELAIDADNKDKRILLKNYSDSDLRFKTEWTIDVITVSPVSGILPAKGEIGLRLTLINTNHSKLFQDYYENIKILCDGTEKNVSVKIFKDHKKLRGTTPVPPVLNDSIRSGFLGESFNMDTTLVEPLSSSSVNVENIFNFPKEIDLHVTRQGVLSETILIVSNPTKSAVSWSIHPSTVLFSQPFDDSMDYTNSVIGFVTTSGTLKPSETKIITIKFLPGTVALFSQFFELAIDDENGKRQTCTIKVQGEAVADFPTVLESRSSEIRDKKPSAAVKKKAKTEIFSEKEVYIFPVTASGQKSTQSVKIKNISHKDHKLTILKPKLPFVLKYSTVTVKSQKYLTFPVHFKPHRPGFYESELKLSCENGYELKIKLTGSCSA